MFEKFTEGAIEVITIKFIIIRGCQSWTIFYLTSNFFFCEYHALADNLRLSQPKKLNFDYPQMHKISYKISYIYLFCIRT